jgi:hypothetical protein
MKQCEAIKANHSLIPERLVSARAAMQPLGNQAAYVASDSMCFARVPAGNLEAPRQKVRERRGAILGNDVPRGQSSHSSK